MVVRDGDGSFIDFQWPSFWYFVKAGVAFTLGAGVVYVAAAMLWLYLISQVPGFIFLRALSHF